MKSALGSAALLLGVAAAPAPLIGIWSGDRLSFSATADGTIIQSDCASGRIAGPITTDASGGFVAHGYFNDHTPGPQLANVAPADRPTKFVGVMHGDTLQLTMTFEGKPPRHFALKRGARIKFVRCL